MRADKLDVLAIGVLCFLIAAGILYVLLSINGCDTLDTIVPSPQPSRVYQIGERLDTKADPAYLAKVRRWDAKPWAGIVITTCSLDQLRGPMGTAPPGHHVYALWSDGPIQRCYPAKRKRDGSPAIRKEPPFLVRIHDVGAGWADLSFGW